jgi:serine/threonine protein kinase
MEHPHIVGLSEWRPLARGGMAVVWQARQLSPDRQVAVKVYLRRLNDVGADHRFLQEAAVAAQLSDHAGIVTIHDAGILCDGRPYLIMELCSGGSLTSWLQPENRPDEERVRLVGVQIADALAAAHACGVVHGDVKPANIVIDRCGNFALADFTFASLAGAEAGAALTPSYAPPEAFDLQGPSQSGDVFSLAATLYALLSGSPPRALTLASGTREELAALARKPVATLPAANWYLMAALMAALNDDPAARPTATEFHDQLTEAQPAPRSRPVPLVARRTVPPPRRAAQPSKLPVVADASAVPRRSALEPSPRSRGGRRVGLLSTGVTCGVVIAGLTVVLVNGSVSPRVPAATMQQNDSASASSGELAPRGRPGPAAVPSTPATTRTAGTGVGDLIQIAGAEHTGKPFEAVPVQGTLRGGSNTLLRTEHWEGGRWVAFPFPTHADRSGRFTSFVELDEPGRYRIRVADPGSGVKSRPFVLVIQDAR